MEKIQTTLSSNMKKIREVNKLSQLSLAEESDLSVQMIRDIEAGRRWPSASSLESIAKALDVRVSELFIEYPKNQNAVELKKALKVLSENFGYDIVKLKS
jgi:transcriptional regulator with XRE-family HTH domain